MKFAGVSRGWDPPLVSGERDAGHSLPIPNNPQSSKDSPLLGGSERASCCSTQSAASHAPRRRGQDFVERRCIAVGDSADEKTNNQRKKNTPYSTVLFVKIKFSRKADVDEWVG